MASVMQAPMDAVITLGLSNNGARRSKVSFFAVTIAVEVVCACHSFCRLTLGRAVSSKVKAAKSQMFP